MKKVDCNGGVDEIIKVNVEGCPLCVGDGAQRPTSALPSFQPLALSTSAVALLYTTPLKPSLYLLCTI